jgi:Crp-like helix-turn-helix domain
MLGIRRASVSEVAHKFQEAGVIAHTRGRVRILDRERMQAAACECYVRNRDEYERLFGED